MPLRNKITFLFLFFCFCVFSQEVKVLRQSGFKHDYVVGKLEYIEEIKDTSRLKYIATLQIEDKTYNWTGVFIQWLDRFQTEAKKLGANTFCIDKYVHGDSTATLSIKTFFAGTPFLKENEAKRDKNNIVCFSSFNDLKTDSFYLNKAVQNIDPKKFYLLKADVGKEYNLAVNAGIVPQVVKFSDDKKPSKYFIAPFKKGTITTAANSRNPSSAIGKISGPPEKHERILLLISVHPSGIGLLVTGVGILASLRGNKMMQIDYKEGRFITDLYK